MFDSIYTAGLFNVQQWLSGEASLDSIEFDPYYYNADEKLEKCGAIKTDSRPEEQNIGPDMFVH